MELIIRISLLASSLITFVIGAFKYRKNKALFKILVTAAIGCFMLGRLYELVTLLIRGSIPEFFNVGMLANLGGFLFILSASYSQMDGLVDDKSKVLTKHRLIACIAPVTILVIGSFIFKSEIVLFIKILIMIAFLAIAQASYYNLKHVIIPDVSYGIIASIRLYSASALGLNLFSAIQFIAEKLNMHTLWMISSIFVFLLYPLVVIAMDRGSKKWTL